MVSARTVERGPASPISERAVTDFPEPDSPTSARQEPGLQGEGHVADHVVGPEGDVEVAHLECGRGFAHRFPPSLFSRRESTVAAAATSTMARPGKNVIHQARDR